jgi:molybdopterin-guanine dinucleotide biosynthesis protein B
MVPVIAFVGYANTGKTTLVVKIINILLDRGYRVAVVKHAPHGYDLDVPGRDTWQYYQSGAHQVMVVGRDSLTLHERLAMPPTLAQICERLQGVDLIIVEGFKQESAPKIEVLRQGFTPQRLDLGDDLVAVVSEGYESQPSGVPCFSPQQSEEITDFIIDTLKIKAG